MKITTVGQLDAFNAALDNCESDVWLIDAITGDEFNLKSVFSKYIAIGELLKDNHNLELFCDSTHDTAIMLEYFRKFRD